MDEAGDLVVLWLPARLTPTTETRMLTRKKLIEAPFNDSQSYAAEKAMRLDNKICELNIVELESQSWI